MLASDRRPGTFGRWPPTRSGDMVIYSADAIVDRRVGLVLAAAECQWAVRAVHSEGERVLRWAEREQTIPQRWISDRYQPSTIRLL